ncbi:MAG: A/G-specific adenine glycosylase [Myxococcales bacterium]|nr:A/G-specific adenine glycosylase [Myxococcales bacterium]
MRALAIAIVDHYRRHRRDLPWRRTRDPYAIWVSEIMLQQTRVATVIPYWQRWMTRFPTVGALAAAEDDAVMEAWAGLGYYSRARNLVRGARVVVAAGGAMPADAVGLRALPGVGAYTAGAIASIAYRERAALVDGNVARVLARVRGLDDDVKSTAGQRRVWAEAEALVAALPAAADPGELNQGLMELGATVCTPTSPRCAECPLSGQCVAARDGRQAELPVVPKRKRAADLPRMVEVALWLARGARVLVARRAATGLYGGLWELPQGADAVGAAAAVGLTLAAAPVELGRHHQTLSHRRLELTLVRARARGRARVAAPRYDAVRWVEVAAADALGVSTATTALLRLARLGKPPRAR